VAKGGGWLVPPPRGAERASAREKREREREREGGRGD